MKGIICAVSVLLLSPAPQLQAEEDARFVSGNLGVENAYLNQVTDAILKAFDRKAWSLRGLESVRKAAGTYVVSGFVTLDEVKEPVTEKDFARISKCFEPFIEAQMDLLKKKGLTIHSIHSDFPLPAHAKGYTEKEIPKMSYVVSGENDDLFCLDLTFSERKADHTVVSFTIVTVP